MDVEAAESDLGLILSPHVGKSVLLLWPDVLLHHVKYVFTEQRSLRVSPLFRLPLLKRPDMRERRVCPHADPSRTHAHAHSSILGYLQHLAHFTLLRRMYSNNGVERLASYECECLAQRQHSYIKNHISLHPLRKETHFKVCEQSFCVTLFNQTHPNIICLRSDL